MLFCFFAVLRAQKLEFLSVLRYKIVLGQAVDITAVLSSHFYTALVHTPGTFSCLQSTADVILGEVFCKIKTKSAIKLLVLYPGKLLKIMP